MASERQLRANRRNAQRSTGPKSRAGKARASQNAYRHGLGAGVMPDPDWIKEIEALAKKIVDSTRGQIELGQARSVARAQLEVLRIRSMSMAVVTQILNHSGETPAPNRKPFAGPPDDTDRTSETIGRALTSLKVFDRYETRAASRRDKVIRQITEVETF
jgi:hypothetical protein